MRKNRLGNRFIVVPVFLAAVSVLALVGVYAGVGFAAENHSSVVTHGSGETQSIALTFDADMTPLMLARLKSGRVKRWYDPAMMNILEEKKVPATFFVTGLWARTYPDEVRRMGSNPLFEVGNHSYDHAAFRSPCYKLSEAKDRRQEIEKTQNILKELTGKAPAYFRFPGGCFSNGDVALAESEGLKVIEWSVVSGDGFSRNEEKIYRHIIANVRNGSIVVMHMGGPNAPETIRVLPRVIDELRQKGYSFLTVSELLKR